MKGWKNEITNAAAMGVTATREADLTQRARIARKSLYNYRCYMVRKFSGP